MYTSFQLFLILCVISNYSFKFDESSPKEEIVYDVRTHQTLRFQPSVFFELKLRSW